MKCHSRRPEGLGRALVEPHRQHTAIWDDGREVSDHQTSGRTLSWAGKPSTPGQSLPRVSPTSGNDGCWGGAARLGHGAFADAAPLSSKSRNALPSGVICQQEQSHKTNF